jgi:AcrR family transcriptional regulator
VRDAATRLFSARPYEDVSLQSIADEVGVALKTVVRQFGTKDALFVECVKAFHPREMASRDVEPGNIPAAIRTLVERYEELGDMTLNFLAVEDRLAPVADMLKIARNAHVGWLGQVFAQWLPRRDGPLRRRRIAQLFGVTEIYVWVSWRKRLGLDRETCETAMKASVEALLASFGEREGG